MVDNLDIPAIISYLIHGHIICNLMYYHILHLTPLILHLPFALECICLHKHDVTWHELHGTGSSVMVLFLPICFTIGLVLCFSISFFEALNSPLQHMQGLGGGVHGCPWSENRNPQGGEGTSQTSSNAVNSRSLLTAYYYTLGVILEDVAPTVPSYLSIASFPIILNRV